MKKFINDHLALFVVICVVVAGLAMYFALRGKSTLPPADKNSDNKSDTTKPTDEPTE
jgi:hypothetical protein